MSLSPVEAMTIRNTEQILTRASDIDFVAWLSPLKARLQRRRNESYAQARNEFILSVRDSI